ncbi:chromosome associated protein G isoform X2 [Megalopta genalis]|uniref:chromosome associated protein G isoform X2 n=1 Tax=Megalopta genalis TaxID=115081 RepID=UPI003FCF65FB
MSQKFSNSLSEIFYNVQFNKTCHQSNLKLLKKHYEKTEFQAFWNSFVQNFRVPLSIAEKHPRVQNTLEFVAKFAVCLYTVSNEDGEEEEPLCPFLVKMFDFLLTSHNATDPAVRFRICQFLNILLNSMGDQAFVDDVLCDKITVAMMDRLLDKSPKVRAQAILALHRLQDPSDEECPIIKMYIFHASKDPNAEVRKAALLSMGKNKNTLQVALKRTRDVNEGVRKMAYEFLSKITVRSLTITQRDQLLNDGLKDRSEIVRKCVENILLPSWLRHFNGDFIGLVKALDAEIGTDVASMALETLFKKSAVTTLIEQLPINKETKLISVDKLTSENIFYWRCLIKHFHRESSVEQLEMILPELSTFCTYISDYIVSISTDQNDAWVKHMQQFIHLQLFEIVTTYDLSDEVGRKKLDELICNTLMSTHWSEKIIQCVVTHLQKVIPDTNTRVDALANIISDIRLPLKEATQNIQISEKQQHDLTLKRAKLKVKLLELKEEEYQAIQNKQYLRADELKNEIDTLNGEIMKLSEEPQLVTVMEEMKEKTDSETMIKCLTIICTMMQSVTSLTPTIRSMMQITLDSLDHPDDKVHILAIKALGIFCVLDKEVARKHIMVLFLQFSLEQENPEIWTMTLKGIFDLLLFYGLEYFDMLGSEDVTTNRTEKSRTVRLYTDTNDEISVSSAQHSNTEEGNHSFIKILTGLLDNTDQGIRTIATEGLCKLLLNRRISSSILLSRLILLSYNPVNDNDYYLRQCLSGFFDNFLLRVPDAHQMFEEAYLPTLQVICNAPETSPLQEIDPYEVSKFMLSLTRFKCSKSGIYCPHNSLVFVILAEVLNPMSSISRGVLIKSLRNLHLEFEDNATKENLVSAIDKVAEMMVEDDKRLFSYVNEFKRKLETPNVIDVSAEDEDTEDDE